MPLTDPAETRLLCYLRTFWNVVPLFLTAFPFVPQCRGCKRQTVALRTQSLRQRSDSLFLTLRRPRPVELQCTLIHSVPESLRPKELVHGTTHRSICPALFLQNA